MSTQAWQNKGKQINTMRSTLINDVLSNDELQVACGRYINSLDLQGQINNNNMTEAEALKIAYKEAQNFKRKVATQINAQSLSTFDQSDLTIESNMTAALNNPDTYASRQANAQIEEVILEEVINELNIQSEANEQQATLVELEEKNKTEKEEGFPPDDALVGAAFVDCVAALSKADDDSAEKAIKDVVEKTTGVDVSTEPLLKEFEEEFDKEESRKNEPVPRPPTTTRNEKE
ncbi:MAG: hypothetical protein A3E82_05965 [Gammaproteobacteria bacterium RIFCSPHIGHO2_12_FULL_38_11]|nr:MAG: hypothetical protein A3E82_05965 [Gammaproteobacteria bacterium RIFCSPHIGHO2_12_FULL_38_11]